jgi:hypothetical protein
MRVVYAAEQRGIDFSAVMPLALWCGWLHGASRHFLSGPVVSDKNSQSEIS